MRKFHHHQVTCSVATVRWVRHRVHYASGASARWTAIMQKHLPKHHVHDYAKHFSLYFFLKGCSIVRRIRSLSLTCVYVTAPLQSIATFILVDVVASLWVRLRKPTVAPPPVVFP